MSVHLMASNHKGWESKGKADLCAPTGNESDLVGLFVPSEGMLQFEVDDYFDALTKSSAREVNQALHRAGYNAYTLNDCRIHPETAVTFTIERNFWVNPETRVRARFIRTA